MEYIFGVVLRKSLPNSRSLRFVPMLFSGSFIVLCFTFRSVIHIESLIFMNGAECASRFVFPCGFPFFSTLFMRRLSLLHCVVFALCQRSVDSICVGLFLTVYSASLRNLPIFSPIPYCLDYYSFIFSLSWAVEVFFVFLTSISCWLFCAFVFPYKLQNVLAITHKITCWVFSNFFIGG